MKAIVCTKYGPPEVLQLKEVAKPAPQDDEVLIRIYATAVTASDCITPWSQSSSQPLAPDATSDGFYKTKKIHTWDDISWRELNL